MPHEPEGIERTVALFGTTVHYWEYHPSAKRVLVMVHGFRGTHHGLGRLIAQLSEFRILVPDLPGFGDSAPMTLPHTIEGYSQLMREFIAVLGLKKPALLGHSMGSIIVADMVAHQPALTTKLIFVNPIATRPTQGFGAVKIAPGIAYHWLAGRVLPEKLGMKILTNKHLFLLGSASMTKTKDKELRKWIHWNHMEYMKRFSDRKTLLEAYNSSSNTTIADYSEKLDHPILMIAGKRDAIAPIKGQRQLAKRLKRARLLELDNVGHIIHYEKPQEAAAAINDFLKESA